MTFFGIYPNNYLGGTPYMPYNSGLYRTGIGCGLLYGGGAHPSSIPASRINYYSGLPVQNPINSLSLAQTVPGFGALPTQAAQQTQFYPEQNNLNQNQQGQSLTGPKNDTYAPQTSEAKLLNMQYVLETAKNEQGFIGKTIDSIKGATGLGLSSKKCQKYIDAAKAGQIDVNSAYNLISQYSSKQKSGVNLVTSIAAGGLGLLALKGKSGKMDVKSLLTAMGIGASVKAGAKALDRGTNNVQNDTFSVRNVAQDVVSGALNGATTYTVAGVGGLDKILKAKNFGYGAMYGGSMSAAAGAVMGATDYTAGALFDKDEKFSVGNLLENSAKSAAILGSMGAIAGGIKGGLNYSAAHPKTKKPEAPASEPTAPAAPTGSEPATTAAGGSSATTSTAPTGTEPPVAEPPVAEPPVAEPPVTEPPASTGTKKPVVKPAVEPPVVEPSASTGAKPVAVPVTEPHAPSGAKPAAAPTAKPSGEPASVDNFTSNTARLVERSRRVFNSTLK